MNRYKPALTSVIPALCVAASLSAYPAFAGSTTSSGVPNPSAQVCLQEGGQLRIITDASGAQGGVCDFGGAIVESWTFWRALQSASETQAAVRLFAATSDGVTGESPVDSPDAGVVPASGVPNPAAVFCVKSGGALRAFTTNEKTITLCAFADGSALEQWTLWRGAGAA